MNAHTYRGKQSWSMSCTKDMHARTHSMLTVGLANAYKLAVTVLTIQWLRLVHTLETDLKWATNEHTMYPLPPCTSKATCLQVGGPEMNAKSWPIAYK